jgi:phosphoglycerate dehydrogenase-like enzyme
MKSLAVASRSFSKNIVLRNKVLKLYPDTKFNDGGHSLNGDSLVEFLSGYEKAILALETIDESVLSRLPNLKVIGKYGVGLDMIDLKAMEKYDVKLGWTGGVNKRSVSELVVSFAIYLLHRVVFANNEVKRGEWYQVKGRQLSGRTVGIIGCGHIGKDLVGLLKPFGCKILVHDIVDYADFYRDNQVDSVGLEELAKQSDIISVHLPLNGSTKNIINKDLIEMFKENAIFINVARGGLVDEVALEKRLIEGTLGGAALDVFAVEPPLDNKIAQLDTVIVTPHIGGSTEEAILAMGEAAIAGLETFRKASSFIIK